MIMRFDSVSRRGNKDMTLGALFFAGGIVLGIAMLVIDVVLGITLVS